MRQPTASSRELPQKCHRWRLRMQLWCISLSLGVVGHVLFAEAQSKELLNWCAVGDEEFEVCSQLIKYLRQHDESAWGCYKASSVGDCITAVENGNADFVTLDPGKAYLGYKYHGLFPVLSVSSGKSELQSNAVAVVKADFCGNVSLKGKVSCHSGYRELAGWYAPVGMMLDNGTIPQVDEGNDVESVESYFLRSCAPGDESGPGICSSCSSSSCSDAEDAYAGDSGAIGCLMNGGDVAFVRESAVLQYLNETNNQEGSTNVTQDNFRKLCQNFTCQDLNDPATCVWLKIPNNLVMTRIGLADTTKERAVYVLGKLSQMEEFQAEFFSPSKNPKGLIFQFGVTGLVPVTTNLESLLGRDVLQAIAAVHRLDLPSGGLAAANASTALPNVKWCAVGEPEFEMCNRFVIQLNNNSAAYITWSCIMQDTVQDCIDVVENGTADVLSVSADLLFKASHYHGLSAIMSENCYDASTGGYWTVAVVPKEVCDQSQDVSFAALKGKHSCHGVGYGDTAGWMSPVATIANLDLVNIPTKGRDHSVSNDIVAVTEFFSSVCAPGTPNDKLCTACQSSCSSDTGNTPLDSGARDCLNSSGDVAFIRCPREMAPGVFKDIDKERFRLLCRQGGCASMAEVDVCHFFYVPFKAVVVRDSMQRSVVNGMTSTLAVVSKSENFRAMFREGANSQSLLFSESLLSLSKIITTTDDYLNTSLDMFATYYELYSPPTGVAPLASHSARNRDLTIIYSVAIAIVVVICIALGAYCYIRSKKMKENAMSRRQAMEYSRAEWN